MDYLQTCGFGREQLQGQSMGEDNLQETTTLKTNFPLENSVIVRLHSTNWTNSRRAMLIKIKWVHVSSTTSRVGKGASDWGRKGRIQQNGAILMAERCKLDRRPLDEVWNQEYIASCWMGTLMIWTKEMKLKGEVMLWGTVFEGRADGREGPLQELSSICLKLLQIGPYVLTVDPI